MVYSTNSEYQFTGAGDTPAKETLPKEKQRLIVSLDKRNRGGKKVTLVKGFVGSDEDLENLGKELKGRCGTGGSVKNREIIIQGDFRDRITEYLNSNGYNSKRGN